MIKLRVFGKTPQGQTVYSYTLTHGNTQATVLDFGATLQSLVVPNAQGEPTDVVLGFDSLEGYLDNPACHGATIGPSANRVDKGQITLDGHIWQLPTNDGPSRQNNLHSDLEHGLHKRLWHAQMVTRDSTDHLVLHCSLEHGELGLPGKRTIYVDYSWADTPLDQPTLVVEARVTTDVPTFVNLTNHSYFNLDGHASGSILDHTLRIAAHSYLPLRSDCVSYGTIDPVAQTPFDFSEPHSIGEHIEDVHEQLDIGKGYDHCFVLNQSGTLHPALTLKSAHSGIELSLSCTTPGIHVYTGNWLDDTTAKDGARYMPRAGVAFESEFWPNCNAHPAWPQPICTPDAPYQLSIHYRFSAQ